MDELAGFGVDVERSRGDGGGVEGCCCFSLGGGC